LKSDSLKVGSIITFNNIYYSYNSYSIEEGAAYELDALAEYLANNPNVRIELVAHTDARGYSEYNQNLSKKRASAAKDYLILKGIDAQRIKFNGKGETEIRNHCKNGVQCSDEDHNYNRRTEVIILSK
ncbi:MAG: OmpA family protein, partial [Saprospiraceae bacterium]|nr:OmpA family protein [Saprospiraceae bacterium]